MLDIHLSLQSGLHSRRRRGANCAISDSLVDFVQKGLPVPATGRQPVDWRVPARARPCKTHCTRSCRNAVGTASASRILHARQRGPFHVLPALPEQRGITGQRLGPIARRSAAGYRAGQTTRRRRLPVWARLIGGSTNSEGSSGQSLAARQLCCANALPRPVVQLADEEISLLAAPGWRRDAGARDIAGLSPNCWPGGWKLDSQSPDDIERFFVQLTEPIVAQLQRSAD